MRLAIFDLDGTLADDSHRVNFAVQQRWVEYFNVERMLADPVHDEGRKALEWQHGILGWDLIYLTGRRENRRAATQDWLAANGFPDRPLYMRKNDSHGERLAPFKVRIISELHKYKDIDAFKLFDDDDSVIASVGAAFGAHTVEHCTWQVKPREMIKWGNA